MSGLRECRECPAPLRESVSRKVLCWCRLSRRTNPIAHAAIDLDALGLARLPSAASNDGVMYRNLLQSVCKNYACLGARRFLLARAMEDRAGLEICRGAVSAAL
jgi:hypothetical protein